MFKDESNENILFIKQILWTSKSYENLRNWAKELE